jgi:hypothetical protein
MINHNGNFFFSYKRSMARTIIGETKKEVQRKAKRHTTHMNQKIRRNVIRLMVIKYFTHGPSNVAYM